MKLKNYLRIATRFIVAVIFTASCTAPGASAEGFLEPPQISNRQKAHYDISFTGGTVNTCAEGSTASESFSGKNPQIAFEFFVSKGFSEKQAAGIIGNFMVESGVNPRRVQGSGVIEADTPVPGKGYGLAQWTDSGRQGNLIKHAKPVSDLMEQLNFVIWELKNTERSAYDAFKNTATIRDATLVWMTRYERPGDPNQSDRIAEANKAYGNFSTGTSGSAGDPLANVPSDTEGTTASSTNCDEAISGSGGSIVEIAKRELSKNVIEDPIGCDHDNSSAPGDCGKEVNKYTDSHLEYWCADFVSWVYKSAGKAFKGGASGGWRIPSVEGVQAYMEKSGTFHRNGPNAPAPQPGDVYVINNGTHIGIVIKVQGNNLYTISGNTSVENYSNGVGVGERVYTNYKSDKSITGFGGLR